MNRHFKHLILIGIAISVLLTGIGAATVDYWLPPVICRIASLLLNVDVRARSVRFDWEPETIAYADDVQIRLQDGRLVTVEQIQSQLAGNLRQGFRPTHTRLIGLEIDWHPEPAFSSVFSPPSPETGIQESMKRILSDLPHYGMWELHRVRLAGLVDSETIYLEQVYLGPSLQEGIFILQASGTTRGTESSVPFSVEARLGVCEPFAIDASVRARDIDIDRWPLHLQPISDFSGKGQLELSLSGGIDVPIALNGTLQVNHARFRLKTSRGEKRYEFPFITTAITASVRLNEAFGATIAVDIPNTMLLTRLHIPLESGMPKRIALQIESPWMDVRTFQRIFPAPLIPRWISEDIVERFQGGKARIETFSLEGNPEQLANPAAAGNEHVLQLRVRLDGVEARFEGFPYPVSNLNALVAIQDAALTVSDVSATLSKSFLRMGSYHIARLYTDNPEDRMNVRADIDLTDLEALRKQPWFSDWVPPLVQEIGPLSGTASLEASIDRLLNPKRLHVSAFDSAVRNASLTHRAISDPVTVHEATFHLSSDRLRVSASCDIGDTRVKLAGEYTISAMTGQAHLSGQVDAHRLLEWIDPASQSIQTLSGRIWPDIDAAISRTGVRLKGGLRLDSWNLQTPDVVVRPIGTPPVVTFDVDIRPDRSFRVNRLTLQAGDDTLSLSSDWAGLHRLPERIQVRTDRFAPQHLGLQLTAFSHPISGLLKIDAEFTPQPQPPYIDNARGRIDIEELGGLFGVQCFPIDIRQLSIQLDGEHIQIQPLQIQIGEDAVDVSGNITGLKPLRGEGSIHAARIDIPRIVSFVKCLQSEPSGFGWFPDRLDIQLHVDRLSGNRLQFGPFDADLTIDRQGLRLDEAVLRMSSGRIRLKGARSTEPTHHDFIGYIQLTRQDAEALFQELGWNHPAVQGLLSMDALFRLKTPEFRSWKTGIDGTASLLIENGRFLGSNPFLTIFSLLSVQNLIRFKSPELVTDRFPFDRMVGEVTAENGVFSWKGFRIDSPVFNAVGTGTLQLESLQLDADIGVHPLTAIDNIVSNIPLLGHVLTGDEKALWEYLFSVSGVLPDVSIRYKPLTNVPSSIWGYLKRSLKLPQEILSAIFGKKADKVHPAPEQTERELEYEREKILSPFEDHVMGNE